MSKIIALNFLLKLKIHFLKKMKKQKMRSFQVKKSGFNKSSDCRQINSDFKVPFC